MTAVGDVDALHGDDAWNARLLSDARDAFDSFVLHPYDFSVDDDARIQPRRARAQDGATTCARPRPTNRSPSPSIGLLFGGGTLLNALVTVDMTRIAIEEQLAHERAPHPHRDRRHRAVRRLAPRSARRCAKSRATFAVAAGCAACKARSRCRRDGSRRRRHSGGAAARDAASAHWRSCSSSTGASTTAPARDVRVTLPRGSFDRRPPRRSTGATSPTRRRRSPPTTLGRASGSVHVAVPAHAAWSFLAARAMSVQWRQMRGSGALRGRARAVGADAGRGALALRPLVAVGNGGGDCPPGAHCGPTWPRTTWAATVARHAADDMRDMGHARHARHARRHARRDMRGGDMRQPANAASPSPAPIRAARADPHCHKPGRRSATTASTTTTTASPTAPIPRASTIRSAARPTWRRPATTATAASTATMPGCNTLPHCLHQTCDRRDRLRHGRAARLRSDAHVRHTRRHRRVFNLRLPRRHRARRRVHRRRRHRRAARLHAAGAARRTSSRSIRAGVGPGVRRQPGHLPQGRPGLDGHAHLQRAARRHLLRHRAVVPGHAGRDHGARCRRGHDEARSATTASTTTATASSTAPTRPASTRPTASTSECKPDFNLGALDRRRAGARPPTSTPPRRRTATTRPAPAPSTGNDYVGRFTLHETAGHLVQWTQSRRRSRHHASSARRRRARRATPRR